MGGIWSRVFVLGGLCGLLFSGSAVAEDDTTTFTKSTSHHRYDVYLGTVEQVRPGASAPYRSENVFESEIRFEKQTVDEVGAALAPDSRFGDGIATPAPDGGSWITNAPRPGWWEYPDGGTQSKDQPPSRPARSLRRRWHRCLAAGESAVMYRHRG